MDNLNNIAYLDKINLFSITHNNIQSNNKNLNFNKGQIISAKILDISNEKATLETLDAYKFTVKSHTVIGDKGDDVYFEILEKDKGIITLKQVFIGNEKKLYNENSIKNTASLKEMFKQHNIIGDDFKENFVEENIKKLRVINNIKRKLIYGFNNKDINAVKELLKSGISLEKISFSALYNTLSEINKSPKAILNNEEKVNTAKVFLKNSRIYYDTQKNLSFANKLLEAGTILSDGNMALMEQSLEKFIQIKNLSEGEKYHIIKQQGNITLEKAYISKFSNNNEISPKKISFDGLESRLTDLFRQEKIQNNDYNIVNAKFLIDRDIDVTKCNIDKLNILNDLKDEDNENFLLRIAHNIKIGENPVNTVIAFDFQNSAKSSAKIMENYFNLINNFPTFNMDKVKQLIKNNINITLCSFCTENNTNNKIDAPSTIINIADKAAIVKKQMAQIQHKLTCEAIYRLTGKGIEIGTLPLAQALETLNKIQHENFTKNIIITGGKATTDNITKIENLYNTVKNIMPLTTNVYGNIILKKISFSLGNIYSSVKEARAIHGFETFMTVPKIKYKDSFLKVKGRFEHLLQNIGIDSTPLNIRASQILSKNNIDVTFENIASINVIDEKLNYIKERLHPTIAASLINDGINPLDIPIDKLIDYIDSFNNIYGFGLQDKIASYIYKLEKSSNITIYEKEAVLAVYRALNTIEKYEGAPLGLTLKNNVSHTLGNMLEATRYYKTTKSHENYIDISVHENYEHICEIKNAANTIRGVLEKNISMAKTKLSEMGILNMGQQILSKLNIEETPSTLNAIINIGNSHINIDSKNVIEFMRRNIVTKSFEHNAENLRDLLNEEEKTLQKPLDELLYTIRHKNYSENNKSYEYLNSVQKQLDKVFSSSPKILQFLEEKGLPTTPINIEILTSFVKDQFILGKQIGNIYKYYNSELAQNIMDENLKPLIQGQKPENILNELHSKINKLSEGVPENILEQFKIVQKGIKIQNKIKNRHGNEDFHLPININGKISNLNMYVINKKFVHQNQIKAVISLNTHNIGDVQTKLFIDGNKVTVNISGNSQSGILSLKEQSDILKNLLNEQGFYVKKISYEQVKPRNMLEDDIFPVHNNKWSIV